MVIENPDNGRQLLQSRHLEKYQLVLKRAVIRTDTGDLCYGFITDHDDEGKVCATVLAVGAVSYFTGLSFVEDPTDAPNSCWLLRPAIGLGTRVLFRATNSLLTNPKLPPGVAGVLPGIVVGRSRAPEGSAGEFVLHIMLFLANGTIVAAHGATPIYRDMQIENTCWSEAE